MNNIKIAQFDFKSKETILPTNKQNDLLTVT